MEVDHRARNALIQLVGPVARAAGPSCVGALETYLFGYMPKYLGTYPSTWVNTQTRLFGDATQMFGHALNSGVFENKALGMLECGATRDSRPRLGHVPKRRGWRCWGIPNQGSETNAWVYPKQWCMSEQGVGYAQMGRNKGHEATAWACAQKKRWAMLGYAQLGELRKCLGIP